MRNRHPLPSVTPWILSPFVLACTHSVEVEPVEVKPIHVTVDVNVRVQRELQDFFDYEDELSTGGETDEGPDVGQESGMEPGTLTGVASVGALTSPAALREGRADEDELRERMKARYPDLQRLRNEGKIGEIMPTGLAEVVDSKYADDRVDPDDPESRSIEEFLAEENKDRKLLYERLARRLETSPEEVAEQNALRNLKKGEADHWFRVDGRWVQKKQVERRGG